MKDLLPYLFAVAFIGQWATVVWILRRHRAFRRTQAQINAQTLKVFKEHHETQASIGRRLDKMMIFGPRGAKR